MAQSWGMIGRRGLATLGLGLAGGPALAAAPAPIRFRIMREGSSIGTHTVTFAETGPELTARTEVLIQVRLMGITVFRLTHRFDETWAQGRLQRMSSQHDRNGTVRNFTARAEGDALVVTGGAGPGRLPGTSAPLAWWDPSRFGKPLFDADDGKPLRLEWSRAALANGGIRWRATGDETSEASYDRNGAWLDWTTRGDDGSVVVYERA